MKNLLKWREYLLIYAGLLFILNLFLVNLPLAKVFGYEFSTINAIVITLLSGIYILSSMKRGYKNRFPVLSSLFKNLSILLLIPFTISIINSVFTGFCSFYDGLLFYMVITLPSVLIGGGLGMIAFAASRRFRLPLYLLLFIAVILIAFFEIYFKPHVFLFNPVFGYFPGTIYDEGISVDLKLFFYRFLNSIFFFLILSVFHSSIVNKKSRTVIWRRISYFFAASALFYFFLSPVWGYSTTFSKLKNELSVVVETEHFTIYAHPGIEERSLKYIAVSQEYFYGKISAFLGEEFDEKINSFIFKTSSQKKILFGSGNADVAKPWQNSVYVSFVTWESTLEHEIAHCFAGKFGWGIFKVAADFNPALIEGVAEACDGFYDEMNIHFLASIAEKNEHRVSISNLFTGLSFFGNVSGLSYIYSGSFIRFLIDNYGVEKVKRYYRSNDFSDSFDMDIGKAEKEYKQFLVQTSEAEWTASANYYFGRQSLIQKVCPRYITESLSTAWGLLGKEKYKKAEVIFIDVLKKTDSYSAAVGLSMIYEKTNSLNSAVKILEEKIDNFRGTSYEYNLLLRIADLKVRTGNRNEARGIYKSLKILKPNIVLETISSLRLVLLEENKILSYVSGSDFDKYFLLRELNSTKYVYNSIPAMINLSESLKEDYEIFLFGFGKNFEVRDFQSSYAALKISQYMLKNFDYKNARKMAGLSLRFRNDKRIFELKKENFHKAEWFHKNAQNILTGLESSVN